MFATSGHHARLSFVRSLTRRSLSHGVPIDVHPEVEGALASGRPVVALESTIVTHGMPYPTSLEMARSVESIVRSTGSIPATIGLIQGRVKIGLQPDQLVRLATQSADPVKLSRRDIAAAIASSKDGGTTCSTTLMFAALAGIKVFATGGLGGVHRGGEKTLDISTDLHQLARSPVGLVSAGVKSILDIGRTLEYLETLGVPVISYSDSDDFPAFYSRKSGFKAPWRVNDPETAARILYVQRQLGMENGALFAVPILEKHEADGALLQDAIEAALRESEEMGISKLGKEVTPWLLKRVSELTGGKSLKSNVALVENTALVGGQIAVRYANIASKNRDEKNYFCGFHSDSSLPPQEFKLAECDSRSVGMQNVAPNIQKAEVVVVGCAAVDITSQAEALIQPDQKSTYPGKVSLSLGGVARNIAEAAHRVMSGSPGTDVLPLLVAPIGNDDFGNLISTMTQSVGMRTDGLVSVEGQRSAICNLLLDSHGELQCGVSDMNLPNAWDTDQVLAIIRLHHPRLVALDGNVSSDVLTTLVAECLKLDIQTFFEPTSVAKAFRIFPAIAANLANSMQSVVTFVSPNVIELGQMYQDARNTVNLMSHEHWWSIIDNFGLGSRFRADLAQLAKRKVSDNAPELGTLSFIADRGIVQMAINLLPFFQHIVIKCGKLGALVVMRANRADGSAWVTESSNTRQRYVVAHSPSSNEIVIIQHVSPIPITKNVVTNSTGAGDSLVGALLAVLARNPRAFNTPSDLSKSLDIAQQAAIMTLQSPLAVSPLLSSLNAV